MTEDEKNAANYIKSFIKKTVENYHKSVWADEEDLKTFERLKEEEKQREIDPYDYDAPPNDMSWIDGKIKKIHQRIENDKGIVRIDLSNQTRKELSKNEQSKD